MPDAFADATAALAATLAGVCGLAVTYRRGAASVELTAWRSHRTAETTSEYDLVEQYEMWDWILPTAALASLELPEPGDRIVNGDGQVYEIVSPPGQRHFQYSGSPALLRVHTKFIGTEAA